MFLSVNVGFIASLFTFGAVERPKGLGVQDYGGGVKSLSLCPPTPNCIATSEAANDETHYAPPLCLPMPKLYIPDVLDCTIPQMDVENQVQ